MDYSLRRMQRKTVGIYITKEGVVEVRAPHNVPKTEIDRFVREKGQWIKTQQAKVRERLQAREAYTLRPGGTLLFLGREYPVEQALTNTVSFDGKRFLLPDAPEEALRDALAGIYRQSAQNLLPKAVERLAPLVGRRPAQTRVTSAKTRWGSCSGKGGLNFSWRLMFASPEVIDYVVVHELAHLIEFNHSPRFWALVESVLPDWRDRRQALTALQEMLLRQGW